MSTSEEARLRAARTYEAAADHYDDLANAFWERFGRRTVERLALRPGARVLDVCCGSGASAIPAAEAVGPGGYVLGVDLAEGLLALGRAKAAARGLAHLEFRPADMMAMDVGEGFDAVVCVFGIFFAPDMAAAVRALWRQVAPGGRLAITTWGPRLFEPMNTAFWDAVRAVRPDLYKAFRPWDRISDPPSLGALLDEAGVSADEVVAEGASHPLASPEAWWSLALGSGYRGTLEELEPALRERVRRETVDFMSARQVRAVEASVVYAVATRASAPA